MVADDIKVNLIIEQIIITEEKPTALPWAKVHHSEAPCCEDTSLLEERKPKLNGFPDPQNKVSQEAHTHNQYTAVVQGNQALAYDSSKSIEDPKLMGP